MAKPSGGACPIPSIPGRTGPRVWGSRMGAAHPKRPRAAVPEPNPCEQATDILSVEPPRKLGLRRRAWTVAIGIVLAAFSTGFGLASFDAYAIKRIQQGSDQVSPGTLQPVASGQASAVVRMPGSGAGTLVESTIRNFPFGVPPTGVPMQQIERSPESPRGTLPERLPSPNPPTRFSRQAPGPDLIVSADPDSSAEPIRVSEAE